MATDQAVVKRKRGRPSTYNAEIADEICRRRASGESLAAICKDAHMPPESTVRGWEMDNRGGFAANYARAREIDGERAFDEMRGIADEKPKDQVEATWQRTRLDQRKWELSKRFPRKFGDRLEVSTDHSVRITLATGVTRSSLEHSPRLTVEPAQLPTPAQDTDATE